MHLVPDLNCHSAFVRIPPTGHLAHLEQPVVSEAILSLAGPYRCGSCGGAVSGDWACCSITLITAEWQGRAHLTRKQITPRPGADLGEA